MKPAMKPSAVYRMAAELVDAGDETYSCSSISRAYTGEEYMGDWRCEPRSKYCDFWGHGDNEFWPEMNGILEPQRKQLRVLMLLLMSAISADTERRRK